MNVSFLRLVAGVLLSGPLVVAQGFAQSPAEAVVPLPTRTQAIDLQKGWNAVWLEVDPLNTAADTVFKDTPVDICARFFRPASTLEFIKDPAEKSFNREAWAVWYAPTRDDALARSLDLVNGPAAYLIHATSAFQWSVTGTVVLRPRTWKHQAFTLAGFSVDESQPPTFDAYFAGSGGHIGSKIYRLVDGRWQRIPGSSTMRAGEACWIHAADDSRYDGPLSLEFSSHVVDFGPNGSTLTLNAVNRSASPRTITVEAVTAGSSVAGAAGLPLEQSTLNYTETRPVATAVGGSLPVADPGTSTPLRLSVRRDLFTAPRQTALLKLNDGAGSILWVPVRAAR